MKYSRFEILAMVVGIAAVASSILAPLATRHEVPQVYEIIGQLLIIVILFGGLQYSRKGAFISWLVCTGIYGIIVFSLSTEKIGTGAAGELLALRACVYALIGFFAAELNVRIKYLFIKLENHDYVDDITSLYNSKYLVKLINRSLSEYDRYGHKFSICNIHINEETFASMKKSAYRKVLRELGNSIVRGNIRSADDAARADGAFFIVLFPNTGYDGAVTATLRIKGKVENYLDRHGIETGKDDVVSTEVFEYPTHKENLDMVIEQLAGNSSNDTMNKEPIDSNQEK